MRSLKLLACLLCLALTQTGNAEDVTAVQPEKAAGLDPEDIGIAKYVFEATPPAGKVMVLRRTQVLADGKTERISEKVNYTDGKKHREVVLGFDPTSFPFSPDQITPQDSWVRYSGGEISFAKKKMVGHGFFGKVLSFTFANDKDEKESVTFECFVEDYATVKARIPDLPPERPGGGWGYHAPIEPKTK